MKTQGFNLTKSMILSIVTFSIFLIGSAFAPIQNEVAFKVKVASVRNNEGYIHVLLFNQEVGYPTNGKKAYKHIKYKATKGEVTIPIGEIPSGKYSVVVFHDKNSNETFDKTWYGSPKEDYGFSNIPGEFCGTPSFQQTSFVVNAQTASVNVNLMNMD